MEDFSTPRIALLPRAANLATLAVVAAATWWSGAQRPVGQPVLATPAMPHSVDVAAAQRPAALPVTGTESAAGHVLGWTDQGATTIARDGLQAVGYQTRAHR